MGLRTSRCLIPMVIGLTADQPYATIFTAQATGEIQEVYLAHVLDVTGSPGDKTLTVSVGRPEDGGSQGSVTSAFGVVDDPRGEGLPGTARAACAGCRKT